MNISRLQIVLKYLSGIILFSFSKAKRALNYKLHCSEAAMSASIFHSCSHKIIVISIVSINKILYCSVLHDELYSHLRLNYYRKYQ